ncbi:type II toxin-antitoxin system HicB family antitoxin [Corynebacterium sp. MC-04]|uniref:Type II toxin-antitoxin system HicB family antitoxin n=1 Tax=Corynebacterium parakroppenstedtii TaxID=2828363 RepID=A0ABS9HMD2_9CORY|nr:MULTISPECIES: type II toxin-antitoxin system HicB family antitoxin [Corynebacterium]KXB49369.1 toxin-antitoxin system, antitoxin component, HicB family [Corynebacterium kroppenstedtii]MBY0788676.1 type II toxin-antitoxin system HicB family antitoxin [Corynebacterium parakroppenstedtii]MBY0792737.1 type II toxin-antitoxin system HicB family antitoxin [Corynebacterium parakroppenstedtii]MCF6770094.1 type II toxin-antitoxin system HicB family antitoxin [Corynebacterium parakroppenstedtii]MCF67
MDISKYTYQVSWSESDQEYVATVAEFPSLSWLDTDLQKAQAGLFNLVTEAVSDMESSGEKAPEPLGGRRYSGKFNVRIPPFLHRQLAIEAQTQGVSLNALINIKLASA